MMLRIHVKIAIFKSADFTAALLSRHKNKHLQDLHSQLATWKSATLFLRAKISPRQPTTWPPTHFSFTFLINSHCWCLSQLL